MALQLPRIVRSPSTVQFTQTNHKPKLFYKRRFMPNDEAKQTLEKPWLVKTDALMPPYPYGKNETFLEANNGLYGGSTIQSGNKISQGRNKGKTVRKWFPNIRVERIRSEALNEELSIPIAARVMRTIKKCGGLDQYLLGDKPGRIKELGLLGWKLRWLIMNTESMKEKFTAERMNLGLPPSDPANEKFEDVWNDPERREELLSKVELSWAELREKDEKFQRHVKETLRWKDEVPEMATLQHQSVHTYALPDIVEEPTPTVKVERYSAGEQGGGVVG